MCKKFRLILIVLLAICCPFRCMEKGEPQSAIIADTKDPPSNDEAASMSKKAQQIRGIKASERMIKIELTVVAEHGIYTCKRSGQKIWQLVGSDGIDFIIIQLWEEFIGHFRQLGDNYLGKTYLFHNFSATEVTPDWNLGSVDVRISSKEWSAIIPVVQDPMSTSADYYEFLKKKHVLDPSFDPVSWQDIRESQEFDIEAKLVHIDRTQIDLKPPLIKLIVENNSGQTALILGKNIFAWFLSQLLNGKENAILKMQNLNYNLYTNEFFFQESSKILAVEKENKVPTSLLDLIGKRGIYQNMNLRLKIAEPQCIQAPKQEGTICHDGKHKVQFLFPKGMRFEVGKEFIVKESRIIWNRSGVLTIEINHPHRIALKDDKRIDELDVSEMDYPNYGQ